MKAVQLLRDLAAMPLSRRWQWFMLQRSRVVTATWHKWRLRGCGKGAIVQRPLFWTPEFIQLGARVLIWPGCRIEGVDEYAGTRYSPIIRLGDNVSLQQGCHITAAGELIIGDDTTILCSALITDIDHQYEAAGVSVHDQPIRVRATYIGRNCLIGAGARIQAGTHLGDHCVVGTNAVVRGKFPDQCVITGIPARIVKRFDLDSGGWRKTNSEGQFI